MGRILITLFEKLILVLEPFFIVFTWAVLNFDRADRGKVHKLRTIRVTCLLQILWLLEVLLFDVVAVQ